MSRFVKQKCHGWPHEPEECHDAETRHLLELFVELPHLAILWVEDSVEVLAIQLLLLVSSFCGVRGWRSFFAVFVNLHFLLGCPVQALARQAI